MSEADAYVAEWLAREPEMETALLFLPVATRRVCALWAALQRALWHAAFELSEVQIAQAKLAWWRDELARGARGEGRHPLVRELMADDAASAVEPAAWPGLAEQALWLATDERAVLTFEDLRSRYAGYAAAVAAIESALLRGTTAPDSVLRECLVQSVRGARREREWPLQWLARHQIERAASGQDGLQAALRRELAQALGNGPEPAGAPTFRRLRRALLRVMLDAWRAGRGGDAPGPLRLPWLLWRAARRP